MVEAVIFDMDGLMIDSEMNCYKVYKSLLAHYNVSLDKERYCFCFAGKSMVNGLKFAREYYHLDYDIEEACFYCDQKEKELIEQDGVELKEGLISLLNYLKQKNIKTAIASSSGKERINILLKNHDVLKYYDVVVCGNEVEKGKPEPDIFLKACQKLDVKPQNALVLEDSEAGIQAGYFAHIPTICIPDMTYPKANYEQMATAILTNLNKVIDYMEGLAIE